MYVLVLSSSSPFMIGGIILILILYHTRSSDYRDIDPRYGTLADWDKLLHGVHERGMKLMYVNPLVNVSHRDPKFKSN